MAERPLLIFPNPEPVSKPKRPSRFSPVPPPNQIGQAERIEKQFDHIQSAFVSDEPGDVERVLVMETSNQIEGLRNAVSRVSGLEWLAEMDVDDIELHDLYDEATKKNIRGGRFYILSSNKQATDRLLGLWKKHKAGRELEHGFGKFKNLFIYLLTLRRWDLRDRVRDTGILRLWKEEYRVKQGTDSSVDFEIELHYPTSEEKRNQKVRELHQKIESAGGTIRKTKHIADIAFHALKVTLPIASIKQVVAYDDWDMLGLPDNLPPVFNSEAVRYFRPVGQHIIDVGGELPEHSLESELTPVNDNPPVLALLDGAPMLRHNMLENRIRFYDPDNYVNAYEPSQQKHGTAMSSLICHGDLGRSNSERKSLSRCIYARPVMKPKQHSGREEIPADIFQEDIIERAVKEMFDGGNDKPTAPGVRVINLSLGNIDQLYLNEMSPWARLLDWLSFKYNVLFIVSAGNYLERIQKLNRESLDDRKQVLSGIDKNQRNHRLLSPAESMNALTVGALQGDASGNLPSPIANFDPIEDMKLPAPYSRIGPGYRATIKPDICTQGGRLLYEQDQTTADFIKPVPSNEPPGIQVAYPGARPERLNNTAYEAGTSHAAAIISHAAGHIFEMLEDIRGDQDDISTPDFDAVLIKTLLVHSASRGENGSAYEHLKNSTNSKRFKQYLARYLGYGNVNVERVLECTKTRATAVGCGRIRKEQRHRFTFPLLGSASVQDYVRLTVTLAWFSPINPHNIGWRRAKLFFEGDGLKKEQGHERQEADWQQVRKGTVQHEIFELNKNNIGNSLELFVQCAVDAGTLDDEIPYGLAVTLEIAEQETLDLYQIVRQHIRQPVRLPGG